MPVLGINITDVRINKSSTVSPTGQIEVKLTPKIKELRLGEIRLPTGKTNGIEVLFSYNIQYTPAIAEGSIEGLLMYLPPQKENLDEILDQWEKEKRLDPFMFAEVVNFITKEVSPMLMLLAKEMRLPYHIPIPRVEVKSQ
ncbi:hypothetical protein [Thermococcus pacificus]|uniref:Uncharacterized protein n=1 Tax=Thermococcus pacificus TaxID=71998 RepID=A0A218P9P3_9EURY|nr:hypothetical protein [Thermococcus pacificus]ASJ07516.1 hypothetical protein A3L08_09400 [Thermococcus pacificus]